MASKRTKHGKPGTPAAPSAQPLLDKTATFYQDSLCESLPCKRFLKEHALTDHHVLESFGIGSCTGQLGKILPSQESSPQVYKNLTKLGILDATGKEALTGMLTLPIRDADGGTVGIVGLDPASGEARLIGSKPPRIWNMPAAVAHPDLIAATELLDGLALMTAGIPNVIAFTGKPGPDVKELLMSLGVVSLTFACVPTPTTSFMKSLSGIPCFTLALPGSKAPAALLKAAGPEKLAEAIDSAKRTPLGKGAPSAMKPLPDGFQSVFASRSYELRGIEKGKRKLRAAVRAERQSRLHVDTIDFYSARARRNLSIDLCRFFEEAKETIDADIDRLIRLCEQWLEERPETSEPPSVQLTDAETREARALGESPDLLENILADYETCGLVGEASNKLLCYLAAVSRKMPEPISVLILSSSGAGKSALQDATLRFCPPEDVVKLTSMTGKALFYKGRNSLKHRILALEEETGAEGAAYPLRALISSGELVIETTVKDLGSGQLTTVQNRVEGPCSVFITTTSPDTDAETRSRFFVTSVDESRAQTRRILDFQRKGRTLQGHASRSARDTALRKHRNFQRLLQPLMVVNPFAEELAYGDDRLQSRRDQPKLLNLIAAVAFIRQMTKTVKMLKTDSGKQPYIEVDAADMRIADELAGRLLRRTLDDLNPVSFELLGEIQRLVADRIEKADDGDGPPPEPREITFTRRDLREFSGWPHIRVRRYLVELVEMEFICVLSGHAGSAYRYALCGDLPGPAGGGQPGQTWSPPGQVEKSV